MKQNATLGDLVNALAAAQGKPGYKSTETWFMGGALGLLGAVGTGQLDAVPSAIVVEALPWIAVYALARAIYKVGMAYCAGRFGTPNPLDDLGGREIPIPEPGAPPRPPITPDKPMATAAKKS